MDFVAILILMFAIMIFLITQSIMPKKLGGIQKLILITFEFILSVTISYAVNRFFLITYPEHYKAQFLGGLFSGLISFFSLLIYALIFVIINKFFKEIGIFHVLYAILIILVGIGIQAGTIYILEQPYIIDIQGW
ncbi:hypothetical protein PMSD_23220 [Paenibacillus macquariensis subsp. defensor]|nr:hypothetical protein PMSD_23220 [Paenibacillus macquariensis subsp. defensor]